MAEAKAGKKKEGGFRIFHKILLTMILVSLIPLGGLWYISIYKAREDAGAVVADKLSSTTMAMNGRVQDWIDMNLRLLKQNGKTEAILSMAADQQNPLLKSITDTYEWIYLAFTTDPGGANIGRSDGNPTTDYSDRAYVKQILNGNAIGEQVLIGRTSGKPALVLAQPVDTADNKRRGIIAIAMDLGDISKTIADLKVGATGYATLLDGQNRLVAIGKGNVSVELQDMSSHPALAVINKGLTEPVVYTEEGREVLAYGKETTLGWKVIIQQDVDEAYAAAKATQRNAFILLAITLAAVFVIATLLAAGLSKPIRNLTEIADNISRGELGAKIAETGRGDEIGALARAIERMGVSLEMAFKRLRKK